MKIDTMTQIPLLPPGVHDLLGEAALKQEAQLASIRNVFKDYGAQLVLPPLLEYQETLSNALLSDLNNDKIEDTFRTTEVSSGKTLSVRTDITPQIARLAVSRLGGAELPLILGYYGTVLNQQTENRQRMQVGLEYIGAVDVAKISEIIQVSLNCLKAVDAAANLMVVLCQPLALNDTEQQQALNRQATSIVTPDAVTETQQLLENSGINVAIDMQETIGFRYQTGVCFMILDKTNRQLLARGGVYTIPQLNNNLQGKKTTGNAVGFSFYLP